MQLRTDFISFVNLLEDANELISPALSWILILFIFHFFFTKFVMTFHYVLRSAFQLLNNKKKQTFIPRTINTFLLDEIHAQHYSVDMRFRFNWRKSELRRCDNNTFPLILYHPEKFRGLGKYHITVTVRIKKV